MNDDNTLTKSNKNADSLGVDDLVEDIFGLNLRGLKTIWTISTKPWLYFKAAKTPKWEDRYTPSFRVWFAIVAVGTFLQFIWAGENSPMFYQYVEMMKTIAIEANKVLAENNLMIDMEKYDPRVSAKALVKYSQLFLPVGYLLGLLVVAALFHSWGERLSFVVRLRYVFAIIVPGSLLGFVFAMVTLKIPNAIFLYVNNVGLFLMFASYFVVAYFGPFRGMQTRVRLARSLGITTLVVIAVMIGTMIALALAFIPTMTTAFPKPVPLLG